MREIQYLLERRAAFFGTFEENAVCTGSKSDCKDLVGEGYKFVEWDAAPEMVAQDDVLKTHIAGSKAQIKARKLPKFLDESLGIKYLTMNTDFVANASLTSIPRSLHSLTMFTDNRYEELADKFFDDEIGWPDALILPELKALKFIGSDEKTSVIASLTPDLLPNLQYFGNDIADDEELKIFEKFERFTDLELQFLKDYPIFELVGSNQLISIDLGGMNRNFDLKPIAKISSLEIVRLNSLQGELDCSIFTSLPQLKEIIILNSKKVSNVEALLECENLRSIEFLDCGGPFKKDIKKKFKEIDFDYLDIDFA